MIAVWVGSYFPVDFSYAYIIEEKRHKNKLFVQIIHDAPVFVIAVKAV